jgi:acetolactate synthase I/II/III large subunit
LAACEGLARAFCGLTTSFGSMSYVPTAEPSIAVRSGGNVVVDAIAAAGTDALFTIHGVQIEPIFQACLDANIKLVDVRHESTAGFAAEAYARLRGTVGVAAVCPGPGFTNVVTSIANTHMDRVAVLYLVSSPAESAQESNGLQVGLDHIAIATPITKWACKVTDAKNLQRIVLQAIAVATTQPCGPVLIDIPADILAGPAIQSIDSDGSDESDGSVATRIQGPTVSSPDVRACLDQLSTAQRPAILIGFTPTSEAREFAAHLVAASGVACFTTYGAIGTLADDDPHYGGTAYQLGRLPVGERPDVLLAIGTMFGFDTPGLRDGGASWDTKILHVHGDPSELQRFIGTGAGFVGDPNKFIEAASQIASSVTWTRDLKWLAKVKQSRDKTRAELEGHSTPDTKSDRMHGYVAARAVSDQAAESPSILVGDGAVCKHWLNDALRLPKGGRYITHSRFGCMGSGFGLAMGAAYACPDEPIICVLGDGAAGFAIGEFEAVVRHQLPITFVVMNNAQWGAAKGYQLRPGGPQRVIGTELSDADYHQVMIAFGGHGERVATQADLRIALKNAAAQFPTCINVSVNDTGLPPEVPQLNS